MMGKGILDHGLFWGKGCFVHTKAGKNPVNFGFLANKVIINDFKYCGGEENFLDLHMSRPG